MTAPSGLRHGKAKVPFETVVEIRNLYHKKGRRPHLMAAEYGISIHTIWDWVQFKTRISS